MDRYLVTGAILLLLLLSTWLLDDLKVVDLHLSQFTSEHVERKPIGKILSTRQEVKRKNQQSLTWEETTPADTLYYYDAVLTLSQSAAVLKVESETEITMSENTLVVLEPSENSEVDRLRLIFSKGDINALNPNKKALIESNSWTIEAQKGSELNIRSDTDGKMQIEVKNGKARVASTKAGADGGSESVRELEKNQIIEVDQDKIVGEKTLTSELDWAFTQDLIRIYSHKFPVTFPFEWKGEAQKISLVGPHKEQKEFMIDDIKIHQKNLQLEPGLYLAHLVTNGQTSRLLRIQVWQAPLVHLLSPLPRDRLQTELPHSFSWSEGKGAVSYSLDFLDPVTKNLVRTEKTEGLGSKISEKNEKAYLWEVAAFDEDGFVIPSLYSNDVYFVNDPLSAPKLKAVRTTRSTRTPASKPAKTDQKAAPKADKQKRDQSDSRRLRPPPLVLFAQLLLRESPAKAAGSEHLNQQDPKSEASTESPQDFWEATFEWEKVDGANSYQIEISKTPNFQSTEVSERVTKPTYRWEFKDLGIFYWRVAAVKFNGQVGLFSEVAKAELKSETSDSAGVTLRKIPAAAPPPPPPVQQASKPPPKKQEPLAHWNSLWLSPGLTYSSLAAQKGARATLIGPVIYSLGIQRDLGFDEDERWSVVGQASYVQWKPTPSDQYPFQEKLTDWSVELNFLKRTAGSPAAWGLGIERTTSIWKIDLESIEMRPRYLAGPAYQIEFSEHSWLRTSFMTDLKFFQLQALYHTRRYLSDQFFYGAEIQPSYSGGVDVGMSLKIYVRLLFGLDF